MPRKKYGGRKPNTPNRHSVNRIEDARRLGRTLPAEGLLTIFNNLLALASRYAPTPTNPQANEKLFVEYCVAARKAGVAAAPYYEQKIASVLDIRWKGDLQKLTDHQLADLESIIAEATGEYPGSDQGRASPTIQ